MLRQRQGRYYGEGLKRNDCTYSKIHWALGIKAMLSLKQTCVYDLKSTCCLYDAQKDKTQ